MLNLLREIPYFQNLPEELLKKIAQIAVLMEVSKGQVIFTKDSKATGFYILKEGKLKLYTIEPISGKEQIVKIVEPVALFGEAASFSGKNFPVNVEALENSKIVYIDREKLMELAREYPQICINIAQTLAERLYHLVNLVETLVIGGAAPRVAKYLLQNKKGNKVENFKTTLVANILGLTPEAVSRALASLKAQGAIKKEKKDITILDEEKLKKIVGGF
ncbi:MAG: Crp/Fnr family transcriptional regulator [Aquificae bacterium]|nr:Crp/Fnr family transcriptional regulator [Aquificota bacterium]